MLEELVRQFLYHPEPTARATPPPAWVRGAQEVWMAAQDGNQIHGLYWPPPDASRPTILFLHGNAQTVFEWALVQEELAPAGCGLLLIDYPGYGKSTGKPDEAALYAAGRAALAWLAEHGTDAGQVIAFGKSLGGGVATELAATHELAGLVLESTFCSIPAVAKRLLPFMPDSLVFGSERYDSLARMARIQAPVLVIHGERDSLIPARQGRALYQAAQGPRTLHIVAGAGHNDVAMTAGAAYSSWIKDWVESVILPHHDPHNAGIDQDSPP